jgi:hypothetical protein
MKVIRVSEGDLQLIVQDAGTITLFTGSQQGQVVVSGDLLVQGNTTTVESETMTVKDNIIVVNKGETGAGVTLGTSGIQVDRGPSTPDAQILWDESATHYSPTTALTTLGTWVFRRDNSTLTGIRTNSIDTNGGVLALISTGSAGYVTVTGTANYERNILTYTDTATYNPLFGVTVTDDDRIPNAKAMSDYIAGSFATYLPESFGAGDTLATGFDTVRFTGTATFSGTTMTINTVTTGSVKVGLIITGAGITPGTTITAFLSGAGGLGQYTVSNSHILGPIAVTIGDSVSKLEFRVDNTLEATIDATGATVNNIKISNNTISSTSSSMTLDPFNNTLNVDAYVTLLDQVSDPTATALTNKFYHKNVIGAGDSGLYFVNSSRSDELVSKRRAILFGMIF